MTATIIFKILLVVVLQAMVIMGGICMREYNKTRRRRFTDATLFLIAVAVICSAASMFILP